MRVYIHTCAAVALAIDWSGRRHFCRLKNLYLPNRTVADTRIIPLSVVSRRIVNFPPENRQTGRTKVKAKGNIGDKSVNVNTVISTFIVPRRRKYKQRKKQKDRERDIEGKNKVSIATKVIVKEKEGQ